MNYERPARYISVSGGPLFSGGSKRIYDQSANRYLLLKVALTSIAEHSALHPP